MTTSIRGMRPSRSENAIDLSKPQSGLTMRSRSAATRGSSPRARAPLTRVASAAIGGPPSVDVGAKVEVQLAFGALEIAYAAAARGKSQELVERELERRQEDREHLVHVECCAGNQGVRDLERQNGFE